MRDGLFYSEVVWQFMRLAAVAIFGICLRLILVNFLWLGGFFV